MKRSIIFLFLLSLCFLSCFSQSTTERALVLQLPAMKNVQVREDKEYRKVNDTSLKFDIYYPPGHNGKDKLPLVIFNNGVGGNDVPKWRVYKDWAKLIAANGMAAVNYQSRGGRTLEDGEALIDHLVTHAAELSIDKEKIGMWTCSGNARVGMRLSYKTRPQIIKTLVVYYGGPDSLGQLRQDMPTLLVRAGLDAQFLNTGIDNFLQSAMQQDVRIEMINYLEGMHAFDIYNNTDESRGIIVRTVDFLKNHLNKPVVKKEFILTNKNFMWLVMNGELQKALTEFRKARTQYRADSNFHPFYNAVIREDVLNANAYWLMDHDRKQDAIELFKLVVESYPESPNAYESLSEGYDNIGNKAESIRYAELSLQKLTTASNMSDAFKQRVRSAAEERLKKLKQ